MKLNIEVTDFDINKGGAHAGEFAKCPVARALGRVGCAAIDADEDRILLTYVGKRYLFITPRLVGHFISDFDGGSEVQPMQFILEKPRLATIEDERQPLIGQGVSD